MPRVVRRNTILSADRIPTEHEEQREFVKWFKQNHKDIRILAIPNGGSRTISTAARLKAEGVSAGVPDLFVSAWSLWIEMKRQKGGKVSDDQKSWHEYLVSIGHKVLICYGFNDAIEKVKNGYRMER